MPVRPTTHFTWQVLRTVKRSATPPTGRILRIAPTVSTKDGAFLTVLVEEGLLTRVTGTADVPFEATYLLTPLGEHAAEYGEYEYRVRSAPVVEPPPLKKVKKK